MDTMDPKEIGIFLEISRWEKNKAVPGERELASKNVLHSANSFSDNHTRVRLKPRQGWISDGWDPTLTGPA